VFRYTKRTLVLEIVTVLAAVVLLAPFWVLIMGAFKTGDQILTTSSFAPPTHPTLSNFTTLLSPSGSQNGNIWDGLLSSVIITAGSIIALVALGSLTAYVLARSTRAWSNRAYYVFLGAIVLPTQLGTLPLYIGARHLALVGNPWGMILIYTGFLMPLSVFLYAGFYRRLPRDYEEAASIDGASRFKVFMRVVFPLMAPATGSVAILAGLIVWNDFFTALIFLNGSRWQTLPVVMYNYVGALVSQWNLVFAVVIISMVPILVFYVFTQKRFIQAYAGGLKG
jgi:raffinose/stachyose/melibiose transport system permease protein